MAFKSYSHAGFCFDLDDDVLPGLALTHLIGKDLRTAERLLERFFMDILMVTQERFGAQIQEAPEPFGFRVKGDEKLRHRLADALGEVQSEIYLVSEKAALEALVRRLLPLEVARFRVVHSTHELRNLPPGGLVVLDALDLSPGMPLPMPTGLDHLVIRMLVNSKGAHPAEAWLRDQRVPISIHPHDGIATRQKLAAKALLEAHEQARFSRYFERCRSAHVRWRTHLDVHHLPGSPTVDVSLSYEGEERVMRSLDLKRDIPWAEIPDQRFRDVLGAQSVKERLQEYLDWLRDPRGEPGLRACVLSGVPGTGKTHACLALAGEAQVPCIVVGGSDFLSKWAGESERLIRETFASMQTYDAAVLIIDEFDAIAWRRDQTNEWSAQDQAQIVGELLRAVDKLRKGPGRVVLLATTNQFERVDPALVRSMRMGERIHLGLPSAEDRRALLKNLVKDLLRETELDEAVSMSTGLSPADLVEAFGKARKQALREGESLSLTHLRSAIFERRRGETDGGRRLDVNTKRRVAVHEAGHAVVAFHLRGPDSVEHLSVIPAASGSLGTTYSHRSEGVELMDRRAIGQRLAILLAGRVAEAILYPDTGPSCGVESDMKEATQLAQLAIGAWGLDPEFPLLSLETLPIAMQHALSAQCLERIQHWLRVAEQMAQAELTRHQAHLEALALRLAEAEVLHRPDLLELLGAPELTNPEVMP